MSGSLQVLLALAIGFAVAGLLCCGYQLLTRRPASLHLLQRGPSLVAFAAVPLLTFAAPFIIVRDIIATHAAEQQESFWWRFELAMLATIAAGFWSLMSGTVFLTAVQAFLF